MAQTKVKLISDGVIVQGNLHASHGITTAHIGEGSNLYYTDARVGSYLSTNSFATESYVGTQIANLVDSSPSALNTLNELAAALGDDANFSTTVTNSIALKAPLASPTFTGFARAPYIRATSGGDIALGSISGISRIQGDSNQDIRFLNSSNQDLLTLVASSRAANFGGSITTPSILANSFMEIRSDAASLYFENAANNNYYRLKRSSNNFVIDYYNGTTTSDRLTINSSGNATFAGNVGIGITPNVNSNVVNVIQLGKGMTLLGNVNDDRATMAANLYLDTGTAFRYVMDGYAGRFSIEDGNMIWSTAVSGTAGSVATVDTKMTLLNNGQVGIGLTPNASYSKLQIKTPSSAYGLDLVGRDAGSSSESQITFWNSAQSSVLAAIYNSTSNLYFYTNGDNRMIINSSGNVGIGTTSPDQTGYGYKTLTIMGGTTAGYAGVLELLTPSTDANGQNLGIVSFGSGGTRNALIGAVRQSGNNNAKLQFWTAAGANGIENRMTIDADGQVGIGTDSPSGVKFQTVQTTSGEWTGGFKNYTDNGYGLRVDMSNSSSVQSALQVYTGAGTGFVVKNTGNVGIGTISPAAALDIKHASAPLITRSTNNNATAMYNEISGGYSHLYLYQINGGAKVVLSSNGNSYFNGGYVGIGNTSGAGARTKLGVTFGVTGNAANLAESVSYAAIEMYPYRNSSTYGMFMGGMGLTSGYIQSANTNGTAAGAFSINPWGGNVGIGNTSPNNKLEISDTGTGYGTTYLKISRGADSSAVARVAGIKMGNIASNDGSNWLVQAESSLGYFDNADLNFYHNSSGTSTSKFKIKKIGEVVSQAHEAGSHGFILNSVSRVTNTGYVAGNATLSLTYDCASQGSFFIQCVFNHYGNISSYGCARVLTYSNGPGGNEQLNIQNVTSSSGGSWTITKVSNTRFTIAKTAGSYQGAGHWFVNIVGTGVKYT